MNTIIELALGFGFGYFLGKLAYDILSGGIAGIMLHVRRNRKHKLITEDLNKDIK
jgi:hypothetical protein